MMDMECLYQNDGTICSHNLRRDGGGYCTNCLIGQIKDNTDLLITAIANLTASIEERLCTDKKTNPSNIVICSPRETDERCNACKHSKPHDFILEQCDEVCFFSGKECMKERLCREEQK